MSQNQQTLSIDYLRPLILNVGYQDHHGDWNWKNVSSPFIRIFYVVRGSARVVMPKDEYELTPGHMYLIPSFTLHSYKCDGDFALYYLHIYNDNRTHMDLLSQYEPPFEIDGDPLTLSLIKILCQTNPNMKLAHSDPTSYDNDTTLKQSVQKNVSRDLSVRIESRGILFMLLAKFIMHGRLKQETTDERINRALVYIRHNLTRPISIDDLIEEACLSKDHFIRLFKKEIGMTPLQYINQKKMEYAQLLLVTEPESVKKIAYMLGYDDHSYFIRMFRKQTGQSPLEYRNSHI